MATTADDRLAGTTSGSTTGEADALFGSTTGEPGFNPSSSSGTGTGDCEVDCEERPPHALLWGSLDGEGLSDAFARVPVHGGDVQRVTLPGVQTPFEVVSVVASDHRELLAVVTRRDLTSEHQLHVFEMARTGDLRHLSTLPASSPRFTPDGEAIIYVADYDVYVAEVDELTLPRLIFDSDGSDRLRSEVAFDPNFSRSSMVAFQLERLDDDDEVTGCALYVANLSRAEPADTLLSHSVSQYCALDGPLWLDNGQVLWNEWTRWVQVSSATVLVEPVSSLTFDTISSSGMPRTVLAEQLQRIPGRQLFVAVVGAPELLVDDLYAFNVDDIAASPFRLSQYGDGLAATEDPYQVVRRVVPSPDGSRLAVVASWVLAAGESADLGVYIVELDGSSTRIVQSLPVPRPPTMEFSADSSTLVLESAYQVASTSNFTERDQSLSELEIMAPEEGGFVVGLLVTPEG